MKRLLLPGLVLACLAAAVSLSHAVPARFTLGMKDAAGASYEVMIFAADEKLSTTGPDDMYAAYSMGDRKVEGMWQTTLRKSGAAAAKQKVLLFGDTNRGEFNLNRGMVFAMRGGKGQPDILVVEAYMSSNDNAARLFAITGGKLKPLAMLLYNPQPPFRLHAIASSKFRSSEYDNSAGLWTIRDWSFRPSSWQFVSTRKRQVEYNAPNLKALAK